MKEKAKEIMSISRCQMVKSLPYNGRGILEVVKIGGRGNGIHDIGL
jgi:hypothetical protein